MNESPPVGDVGHQLRVPTARCEKILSDPGDIEFALRDASPKQVYEWRGCDGELLLEVDWPGQSSGFDARYSMYQPDVESAIDQRIRSYPNAEVNQGVGVVAVEQEAGQVGHVVRPWKRDGDEQIPTLSVTST